MPWSVGCCVLFVVLRFAAAVAVWLLGCCVLLGLLVAARFAEAVAASRSRPAMNTALLRREPRRRRTAVCARRYRRLLAFALQGAGCPEDDAC